MPTSDKLPLVLKFPADTQYFAFRPDLRIIIKRIKADIWNSLSFPNSLVIYLFYVKSTQIIDIDVDYKWTLTGNEIIDTPFKVNKETLKQDMAFNEELSWDEIIDRINYVNIFNHLVYTPDVIQNEKEYPIIFSDLEVWRDISQKNKYFYLTIDFQNIPLTEYINNFNDNKTFDFDEYNANYISMLSCNKQIKSKIKDNILYRIGDKVIDIENKEICQIQEFNKDTVKLSNGREASYTNICHYDPYIYDSIQQHQVYEILTHDNKDYVLENFSVIRGYNNNFLRVKFPDTYTTTVISISDIKEINPFILKDIFGDEIDVNYLENYFRIISVKKNIYSCIPLSLPLYEDQFFKYNRKFIKKDLFKPESGVFRTAICEFETFEFDDKLFIHPSKLYNHIPNDLIQEEDGIKFISLREANGNFYTVKVGEYYFYCIHDEYNNQIVKILDLYYDDDGNIKVLLECNDETFERYLVVINTSFDTSYAKLNIFLYPLLKTYTEDVWFKCHLNTYGYCRGQNIKLKYEILWHGYKVVITNNNFGLPFDILETEYFKPVRPRIKIEGDCVYPISAPISDYLTPEKRMLCGLTFGKSPRQIYDTIFKKMIWLYRSVIHPSHDRSFNMARTMR